MSSNHSNHNHCVEMTRLRILSLLGERTPEWLAFEAGLPLKTVQREVRDGSRELGLYTTIAAAHALGVSLAWLTDEDGHDLGTA